MPECRRYQIFGKVQGVWFRESTRRQAVELGLTGHAVNLSDGSVEVIACGDSTTLQTLADWLQHGPPLARVERVERGVCEHVAPDDFRTG